MSSVQKSAEIADIYNQVFIEANVYEIRKFLSEYPTFPVDWAELGLYIAVFGAPNEEARRSFYEQYRDYLPLTQVAEQVFKRSIFSHSTIARFALEVNVPELALEVALLIFSDPDFDDTEENLQKLREAFPKVMEDKVVLAAMSGVRL